MKYFPLLYRLNAEDRYLIWMSNESDRVVADDRGFVLTFEDISAVQAYADTRHYELKREEAKRQDLDWVATWLKKEGMPVDCHEALAAWNLFSDVARSVHGTGGNFQQRDRQFPKVYPKLFWGNNLPSITPEGSHFDPEWSPDEPTGLAEVLGAGLEMFQSCTRPVLASGNL